MSDLVRKLRHEAWHTSYKPSKPWDLLVEAADELERLTREPEEARKDQARLEWFFGPGDKTPFLDHYLLGVRQNYSIDQWRTAIDAAMAQEKRKDALDRMARDADELGLDF